MRVLKKSYLLLFSLVLALNFGVSSNHFAEESANNDKKLVYVDDIFYDKDGKPANWWFNDGTAWYFFKDGKKLTGFGVDGNGKRYFVNGKYANGLYNDKLYKDGVETAGKTYVNDVFYVNGKLASGWYDDRTAWYFFKDGKKFTGLGVDGNGKMYFSNGKYANSYVGDVFCYEGKLAN